MISSSDEALGLLNKWRSTPLLIHLVFDGAGNAGSFDKEVACVVGFVTGATKERFEVASQVNPFFSISIELTGARFTYGEPRDVDTPQEREQLAERYVGTLAIMLPTGGRCFLAELRE